MKLVCDNIAKQLCWLHPHHNQPCDGDCEDKYLQLTVKDWRNDVIKAEGRMESLRGGIMLSAEAQDQIMEIYEALKGEEPCH